MIASHNIFYVMITISDPSMKSSWSDLPFDILLLVHQRLELSQILASAAVCSSWYSAAATTGILPCRVPWLMRHHWTRGDTMTNECRSLLNPDKSYKVSFPSGSFQNCCGASHGWLIASDEISNLMLHNPFSSAVIPLPPVTDFASIKAICGSDGSIKSYHFRGGDICIDGTYLGSWFYQKAVLSCAPSQGNDRCIAIIILHDCNWLSYAKVGERSWHVASIINRNEDFYADCIYHTGKFYTLTMKGMVEMWDIDGSYEVKNKLVITNRDQHKFTMMDKEKVLTRYLVSTPWGDLLQVRLLLAYRWEKCPGNVKVKIGRVDLKNCCMEELKLETALQEHAVFLGQNHSTCLPTTEFHELRPNCIYLTTPLLTQEEFFGTRRHGLRGVRIYDLVNGTLEDAFTNCACDGESISPSNLVWITPNHCNDNL
uniref:F-box domain-containing protein n=1 Tax=Leersia perrieri TaxID=77586 RepID=A0A0D9W899_9ORYZ